MPPPSDSCIQIGIISDTHGHIDPNIINTIKSCDHIIHAGDICGAHILEQLETLTNSITAVAGNNDTSGIWPMNETHVVNTLPQIAEIDLPGGTLVIEHGHRHGMQKPCHDSLRHSHQHARAIVYGHTHTMLIDKDEPIWVINPGAAGQMRTRGGPSCLLLTASEAEWDIEMFRFPLEEVA
jgi:uncharacterized protein